MKCLRGVTFVGGIVGGLFLATQLEEAHKLVTSKYTYTEDVYPIVSQHCGRCHVSGGIAPMSLLTYKDAVPWAESIRAEVVAAHMPPYFAELGFAELKDPHRLSSRELDILLTWATGGTPEGPRKPLPPVRLTNDWRLGRPDVVMPLPSEFTLAADKIEDTQEFVLQGADEDRWVRAADLLPGNAAIVHDAVIYTKSADANAQNVLALWVPGSDPVPTAAGTGFRWPAGTPVAVRIHYRKTWKLEGKPMTDRSNVGLYLLKTPAAREVRSLLLTSKPVVLEENVQALAMRTDSDPADVEMKVEAVRPDGSRVPMISLATRPNWDRRYWFASPLSLPRGTRLNVETSGGKDVPDQPLRLWVDVVSGQTATHSGQ